MLLTPPAVAGLNQSTNDTELKIDILAVRKATITLKVINHPLRQRILRLIHADGKMTVSDLVFKMRLTQPEISQHLAKLRKAGLVLTVNRGKYIDYSVNYERLQLTSQVVEALFV